MTNTTDFDPVSLGIMLGRMRRVAEEMWTTILRTPVSMIIASANDIGCWVLATIHVVGTTVEGPTRSQGPAAQRRLRT